MHEDLLEMCNTWANSAVGLPDSSEDISSAFLAVSPGTEQFCQRHIHEVNGGITPICSFITLIEKISKE